MTPGVKANLTGACCAWHHDGWVSAREEWDGACPALGVRVPSVSIAGRTCSFNACLPAAARLPACPGRLINAMTSCPPSQLSTYLRKTRPSTPSSPASAKQPLAGRLARVWTPPLQSPLSQRRRRAGLCADRLQGYIASVPFRLASIKQCTLVQLTLLICDSSYPPSPFSSFASLICSALPLHDMLRQAQARVANVATALKSVSRLIPSQSIIQIRSSPWLLFI
jgi:hypothetical protein